MLLQMWYFLPVNWLSNSFLGSTYTVCCYICCCLCWLRGQVWSKPSGPEGLSGSLVYTLPRVSWGWLVSALWRHVEWAGVCWWFSSSWWGQGGMWLPGAYGVVVHAVDGVVGLKTLSPHRLNLDEWHHGVCRHSVQHHSVRYNTAYLTPQTIDSSLPFLYLCNNCEHFALSVLYRVSGIVRLKKVLLDWNVT